MAVVVTAPGVKLPLFSRFCGKNQVSARPHFLQCSRFDSSSNVKVEEKQQSNEILQLFKEAQRNILYLNKLRLQALEELELIKNERDSLLSKVQKMEMEKQSNLGGKDEFTISSQLLLRIDSLVLRGMIGRAEASDLRNAVMDSRCYGSVDEISSQNDADFLSKLRNNANYSKKKRFHVIHVASEMSPIASVGSLGPYVTALSRSLQKEGHFVEVILPKYASLKLDEIHGLQEAGVDLYSYFDGELRRNKIWMGVVSGIGVTFIQPLDYSYLFDHGKVYGYSNDFERFAYFSRASLEYIVKSRKVPDVIHIHNWQTSLVGPLFWDVFVNEGLERTRIVLTCQGLESQHMEEPGKLALCGLDPSSLFRPDRLQDNDKPHLVNILKGGVIYSNRVILMSSFLSKGEIIDGYGHGLEHTLATHREKLMIAPHGLDSSDGHNLQGKPVGKLKLQHHLDLPKGASTIIVGCIASELSEVDLEKLKVLVMSSGVHVQFVVMGSIRSPDWFETIPEELKEKSVRFIPNYDEELSDLILCGSDIMLCPSLDDPHLQIPLKAARYGAAPLSLHARYQSKNLSGDGECSKIAKLSLGEAIDKIRNEPSEWSGMIGDAMEEALSWSSQAARVHLSAYAAVKLL